MTIIFLLILKKIKEKVLLCFFAVVKLREADIFNRKKSDKKRKMLKSSKTLVNVILKKTVQNKRATN
ncbi:hypothetical protein CKN61_10555 [Carnobacterium divergens]|nr:hypothetical protein CKN76_10055 [Carnobacterium divergens]TFI87550.1 hypothetical protein CKN61_10555 [Carnobacterium divergens]TFJ09853.1 hypothetical protein CKN71_10055 [Carnobacterium divergens]TFJ16633.1 hypothetical protein CKN57_10025 [Carnobacterium divergens]